MNEPTTYVGLDAHKSAIVAAVLLPGEREPHQWKIVNEPQAVRRFGKKLRRLPPGPRQWRPRFTGCVSCGVGVNAAGARSAPGPGPR